MHTFEEMKDPKSTPLELNRPEPVEVTKQPLIFDKDANVLTAIKALQAGEYVLIEGLYSNGLQLLKELNTYLDKRIADKAFVDQRLDRNVYHELSNRILLEIAGHKLVVKKSPDIGWLEILYPEILNFYLPFPQEIGRAHV